MNKSFETAQEAFEYYYSEIIEAPDEIRKNYKSIYNVGFTILNPLNRDIKTYWRKFKLDYAKLEWDWYISKNPNATEIAKKAKIWLKCMDENGNVNSNYGWQWSRGNQLEYVINELKKNPESRRASISIYDAKDRWNFDNDTPCTYAINFRINNNKLNMSVMMRSNDLVFGFCNDQYCFSKLQEMIALELGKEIGTYFHFVNDLHIYQRHYNIKHERENIK